MKTISKNANLRNSVMAICLHASENLPTNGIHSDMQQSLDKYKDLFHEPFTLPPIRAIDQPIMEERFDQSWPPKGNPNHLFKFSFFFFLIKLFN